MTEPFHPLIVTDHPLARERAVLDRLLALLIPPSPDGRLPGAAELGLYDDVSSLPAAVLARLQEGLRALDAESRESFDRPFAELADTDAHRAVDRVRERLPQSVSAFVTQSAARYYQHDRVLTAIGLEPRPPWPQGHALPEGDWSLLDPVRARGRIYRD